MANLQATTVNGTLVSLKEENETTISKTLALADRDKVVACNNSSDITITVPLDASVAFPIGSVVYISRISSGNVTLEGAPGVTLSSTGLLGPDEEIAVRKRASNNWIVLEEKSYSRTGTGGTLVDQNDANSHSYTANGADTFTVL